MLRSLYFLIDIKIIIQSAEWDSVLKSFLEMRTLPHTETIKIGRKEASKS